MDLKELINKYSEDYLPIKLYSSSKHSLIAQKELTILAEDYPGWYNTIVSLSLFAVQQWARTSREILNIDKTYLQYLHYYGTYFGLKMHSTPHQYKALEMTDNIIDIINTELMSGSYTCLPTVHLSGYKELSKYKMNKYYIEEAKKLCVNVSDRINREFELMNNEINLMDDDIQFAYHDTKNLIKMMPDIEDLSYRRTNDNINYLELYQLLEACIKIIETYPINGNEIFKILKYISEGYNEQSICKITGKSSTYIRSRISDGIFAISYLIWGYTYKNIIN